MKINGQISTNSIKEAIRYIDSKAMFDKYIRGKFNYLADFVDVVARNAFNSKEVTASVIKYANGYNYYKIR